MAQPAFGNIYQMRLYAFDTPLTQISVNTLYYRVTDVTGLGTMTEQSMTEAAAVLWAGRYAPVLANNATFRGVSMQNYAIPLPRPAVLTFAFPTAGTGGANTIPGQVTSLISYRTTFAGRGYRGRIYPAFVPTGFSDANGKMTLLASAGYDAAISSWLNAFEVFTLGGNSVGGQYALRHCNNPLAPPPMRTFSYFDLRSAFCTQKFATQRKRGQYGRINTLPF